METQFKEYKTFALVFLLIISIYLNAFFMYHFYYNKEINLSFQNITIFPSFKEKNENNTKFYGNVNFSYENCTIANDTRIKFCERIECDVDNNICYDNDIFLYIDSRLVK